MPASAPAGRLFKGRDPDPRRKCFSPFSPSRLPHTVVGLALWAKEAVVYSCTGFGFACLNRG
jgi:hypothetical protein